MLLLLFFPPIFQPIHEFLMVCPQLIRCFMYYYKKKKEYILSFFPSRPLCMIIIRADCIYTLIHIYMNTFFCSVIKFLFFFFFFVFLYRLETLVNLVHFVRVILNKFLFLVHYVANTFNYFFHTHTHTHTHTLTHRVLIQAAVH